MKQKASSRRIEGSALAYALVIMSAVMIILVSLISYIVSQLKFSFNRVEREEAFQIAEAGVYYYRWYLAHETSGKTAQQINDFWESGTAFGASEPYPEIDYEGLGKYRIEVTPPSSGSTIVVVKSTGWTYKSPGMRRTVQVRFRRPSWSEYIFISNDYLHFGKQTETYGKVYSSSGVRFDGKAHSVVSCLVPSFEDPDYGHQLSFGVYTDGDPEPPAYPWPDGTVPDRPEVFLAGREFPVPEVNFNGVTTDFGAMKTAAKQPNGTTVNDCTSTGCYFDSTGEGRRIILKNNGTFDVCTVDSFHHTHLSITKYKTNDGADTCDTCSGNCVQNKNIPDGGIIFVEDNIWVGGSVDDSNITIAAANLLGGDPANIYLGYHDNQGPGNIDVAINDCNNIIGLVAQKDVTIVDNYPLPVFTINAALLAQTGRVGMNDYGFNNGRLVINGAVASYLQPYFNHGNNGFAERIYVYDNNLLYCPPNYFPTGTEYSIDLWEEL